MARLAALAAAATRRSRRTSVLGEIAADSSRNLKSRRTLRPVEHPGTKLGDSHGIEQKDDATDRDADRNGALASVFVARESVRDLAIRCLST
jgi:hypothetical protein